VLFAVAALVPWASPPASAASGAETFISITNEPSGPYNAGTLIFDSATAVFNPKSTINQVGTQLDFFVNDNVNGAHVTLTAPSGTTLQPGVYRHAIAGADQGGHSVDGSRPGINVVIGDITCDEEEGSFDLHSFTADPDGNLTSLWLTFRMRCLIPDTQGYMIGDIRWNVPGDGGAVVVGPQKIWWPDEETDAVPVTNPVTVFNPTADPVQLGTASVTGADAADDTISSDGCSGTTLAAGATCEITLEYSAATAGNNTATLEVPEQGGPTHTVALEGSVFSGTTEMKLHSDPGDWLGGGKDYDFVPATAADITADGDYHGAELVWNGEGGPGEWPGTWAIGFGAPAGQTLTPGVAYSTDNGAFVGAVSPGRGCSTETGTFTIDDIYVDEWGDVQRLAAHFDIHCDTSAGDLHGALAFQENSIAVTVSAAAVRVSGVVAPNEPGKPVSVRLERKQDHRFVVVTRRGLRLNHASGYHTKFARTHGTRCRVVAVFTAKRKHLGSRTIKRFHC
jgi:hypothetical protein